MSPGPPRWCLLIHTLPARPLYLRARIRRLLDDAVAAPLRKAVYTMPATAEALERLQAIAREIEAGGGSAILCEATFPDRATADAVIRAYNGELSSHYRRWIAAAERALSGDPGRILDRLRARLDLLRARDRFSAPGAARAQALLERAERQAAPRARGNALRGRRWVTRRGLHVDRLACAWVVRRFIDSRATFRFTANPAAPLAANEIGFDMPGAEIGHEHGGCSMETLIARAGLVDPRLRDVADIVHDIDLGDARHGHPETTGFERLLVGLVTSTPADEDRLEQGLRLFDALYAAPALETARRAVTPRVRVPAALRRRRPR